MSQPRNAVAHSSTLTADKYAHVSWHADLVWEQVEAVRLYATEVFPDMISRHKVDRGTPAHTYNARFAANVDMAFKEAFGPDGAKLDARCVLSMSGRCWEA